MANANNYNLTELIKNATNDDITVSYVAHCHAFQGGETIVDGYVIDNGFEAETSVDAKLTILGHDVLALSGATDDVPMHDIMSPIRHMRIPYNQTRDAKLEEQLSTDILDTLKDIIENPFEYVDNIDNINDELLDCIKEDITDIVETRLSVSVIWDN